MMVHRPGLEWMTVDCVDAPGVIEAFVGRDCLATLMDTFFPKNPDPKRCSCFAGNILNSPNLQVRSRPGKLLDALLKPLQEHDSSDPRQPTSADMAR